MRRFYERQEVRVMSNDKLLQEVYDKIRELDIKLAKKELTLSERDVEVDGTRNGVGRCGYRPRRMF